MGVHSEIVFLDVRLGVLVMTLSIMELSYLDALQ